ncbi:MAG: 4Fe-4S binding protein [Thermoguttaceae bacterium]|jgi:ferredoxin
MLRRIRIVLALCMIVALTAVFFDFSDAVTPTFAWLTKIQFMPALTAALGGLVVSAVFLGALCILTLVFGRVYCSCVCPLGIMQDMIARIRRLFYSKKKSKLYRYHPPYKKTRLCFLLVTLAAVALTSLGWTRLSVVTGVFDPYASYGRIVTHLLYPLCAYGNNLFVGVARHFGSMRFYLVSNSVQSGFAFGVALISLAIVGYMAWRFGRLYCNSVCPVGTLLGFLSRKSLLRVRIDREKCIGCRLCAEQCKSGCIDINRKTVENDRCVVCLNCLESCGRGAIRYEIVKTNAKRPAEESRNDPVSAASAVDLSKRKFLEKSAGALAVGSFLTLAGKGMTQEPHPEEAPSDETDHRGSHGPRRRRRRQRQGQSESQGSQKEGQGKGQQGGRRPWHAVSPPGSISLRHLESRCTSCHLCVARCPQKVIKPAFLEYGIGGIMLPVLKFSPEVFCSYDCTLCGEICPTGAIKPLTVEEKHLTQVGHLVFFKELCVVFTDETNCGACAEHCPTQAVRMVDYKGNLTIPEMRKRYCVGCGACESICPVVPEKAIRVKGFLVHRVSELPPQEEPVEVKLDSFGF